MHRVCVPLLILVACNQPPEGGEVGISPAEPLTADALTAAIAPDATDPNKKDEVVYTWSWSVDGTVVDDLTTATVPADRTAKGQVWTVSVEPSDGKEPGAAFSASVTIGNTAPVASNLVIAPEVVRVGDSLTATYDLSDVDGDTPSALVTWSAGGTSVGTGDSLSLAGLTKGTSVTATLTPNDGTIDGEAITSAAVTLVNTAPTTPGAAISPVDPAAGDALVCALSPSASDADGDSLIYVVSWTLDGAAYAGTTQTTTLDGDTIPGSEVLPNQEWSCSITVDDGEEVVASAPSATVEVSLPDGVVYAAGYYWVKATYAAERTEHAAICAGVGLVATENTVTLDWTEELLGEVSEGFGLESAGDDNCCATSMWCWEGGDAPREGTAAVDGTCETHNFGTNYNNYGTYSRSEFERPVFTCTEAAGGGK